MDDTTTQNPAIPPAVPPVTTPIATPTVSQTPEVTPQASPPANATTPPAPTKKSSHLLFFGLVGLTILILGGGVMYLMTMQTTKKPEKQLPTYFSYTDDEKKSVAALKSDHTMTRDQVLGWSEKTYELIVANKLGDVEVSRILAYVTTAQKDAAYLSYNEKGTFAGSIDPVTKDVLCLFFTADCADIEVANTDDYSTQIATLVVKQVKERIKQDAAMTKPYTPKEGDLSWKSPTGEHIGIDAGSRKPWALKSGDEFRVAPPPLPDAPFWQDQLAKTKAALAGITNEQRESVIYWAGGPGTKTPPGIWLSLTEEHMLEKDIDLEKVLLVRSKVSQAMADAVIAVFDTKWTYGIRRPNMLDKTILTVMPTPNHPSYPSGHATISSAASTVLSHYFPERAEKWEQLKTTAGNGRVWGGIHFPTDNEAGFILGKQVANEVIE